MINEIYNMVTGLRLLTDSESGNVSEEFQKHLSCLCADLAAELEGSGASLPEIVTLFPLNEREKAAFSLSVPEELIGEAREYTALPRIGDIVTLGKYEWIVLHCDEENSACMIAAKDILFNASLAHRGYAGWSGATMRQWLNSVFLISLGTEAERIVKVRTGRSPETVDRVFLLSPEEAESLMTAEQRAAKSGWWLRTDSASAAMVNADGSVSRGASADVSAGIRPAMVISLASSISTR